MDKILGRLKIVSILVLWVQSLQVFSGYFPESYLDSRSQFRALGEILQRKSGIGEELRFKVESLEDDDLWVDGIYLNCSKEEKNPQLLVLTSGVHGPESFVGAGAQLWFMRNEALKRCEDGVSQLFLHALNPYGFKYNRRFDGENIDLNRNFPTVKGLYLTENESYGELEHLLNPKKPVGSLILRSGAVFSELVRSLLGGLDVAAIRQASVGGQYEFPNGIYYGGEKPSPVALWLGEILPKIFHQYDRVLHFDFHTGLGKKGVLHLMTGPSLTPFGRMAIEKVIRPLKKSGFELTTPDTPGFYAIGGDLIDYLPLFKPDGKILSLTAEYGTVGLGLLAQMKTLTRIINENQGHHHGYRNKSLRKRVKNRFKELFHPKSKSWQESVITKNEFLLKDVLEAFLDLSL